MAADAALRNLLATLAVPHSANPICDRVFSMNEKQWQLEGKERPFGFEYFVDNLERAVYYFFNIEDTVPNSWLPLASVIMAIFLLLLLLRAVREKRIHFNSGYVPLGVFLSGFISLFLLLLCYSWDFGGTVVQRRCLISIYRWPSVS